MTLNETIRTVTGEIVSILDSNKPTIYLFGSVIFDDFQLGWSDIDILVLTEYEITQQNANVLVGLRQHMLKQYPNNSYFRLFEGGILSADAFLTGKKERTVYWGTTGQRITDSYQMDSFGMAEILDNGIILHGDDIRNKMTRPTYVQMRDDIANHIRTVRKHGDSAGWLLDIARGIYTLRTGKIIAKTVAGEWALEVGLCPDTSAMQKAVAIRKAPLKYSKNEKNIDREIIQRFADTIEVEFTNTIQRLAESELQRMKMEYTVLSLIRNKDGVSVWRVASDTDSFVMKCFDKLDYRREIVNYQILNLLGVPTLRVIAQTESSIVIEDIERSVYRLGTMDDINNPSIAEKIALWYKTLHRNGREYASTHDFIDEYDSLTMENIRLIQEKTGTSDIRVWVVIEQNFTLIHSAVMSLPRTLVYTDFHYTNLAVARDGSRALIFDYNFFFKSYAYSDIRNVCGNFFNDEAKTEFLSAYGAINDYEVIVDNVVSVLSALLIACRRETFPNWANGLLEKVKNGQLLIAVEKFLATQKG